MDENRSAPVAPSERIDSIDVLRAFALLGILVMNMPGFFGAMFNVQPPHIRWPAWHDRAAWWVMDCLFSGKFNSMFSFLFGVGFAIQMERLAIRSPRPERVYSLRLVALFGFGVVHAFLIWSGDVLHIYAILGAALLLLRRASDRTVKALIVACLLSPTAFSAYQLATATPEKMAREKAKVERLVAADDRAYGAGTYREAVAARVHDVVEGWYGSPRVLNAYGVFFATMLLGFHVGRKRYIQSAEPAFLARVQVWSFAVGIAFALVFSLLHPRLVPFKPSALSVVVWTAYSFQRPALMLFYAATILRMLRSERWGGLLSAMRHAGRMPLTNYIAQSVIGTLIFYRYGLGLYGRCGPAVGLALSLAIFMVQVAWSRWWFARYEFGPLERLWRAATYGASSTAKAPTLVAAA